MILPYIKVSLQLTFQVPVDWSVIPTFFLRTVLGAQLKRVSCVQRQLSCDNCMLAQTCAYSVLFESPLPVDNPVLEGRNRGYHPFILTHGAVLNNSTEYEFALTLVGKGIQYFPFIIFAFQQAGKEGVFSSKIPYEISILKDCANDESLFGKKLKIPTKQQFYYDLDKSPVASTAKVFFDTPARIKQKGHYSTEFDALTLFVTLHRRITSLISLYADDPLPSHSQTSNEYHLDPEIRITTRHLIWKDISRFSHRQNTGMELGGVLGSIELSGPLRRQELSLLEAGNLFHVGKNTGFGLGKMSYEIHEKFQDENIIIEEH